MTTSIVYVYVTIKTNGKKKRTFSLIENSELGTLESTLYRLTADTGKVLTDGQQTVTVIDTNDPSRWTEIDEPTPEPEENNE